MLMAHKQKSLSHLMPNKSCYSSEIAVFHVFTVILHNTFKIMTPLIDASILSYRAINNCDSILQTLAIMCSSKLKCTNTVFGRVSAPDPAEGVFLQCSPRPHRQETGSWNPFPFPSTSTPLAPRQGAPSARGPKRVSRRLCTKHFCRRVVLR